MDNVLAGRWKDTQPSSHLCPSSGLFFFIQDKLWGAPPADLLGPRVRAFAMATAVELEAPRRWYRNVCCLWDVAARCDDRIQGDADVQCCRREGGGSERSDGSSPSRCPQPCRRGGATPYHPPWLPAESPPRLLGVLVTFHPHILPLWGTKGASPGPLPSLAFDPSGPGLPWTLAFLPHGVGGCLSPASAPGAIPSLCSISSRGLCQGVDSRVPTGLPAPCPSLMFHVSRLLLRGRAGWSPVPWG